MVSEFILKTVIGVDLVPILIKLSQNCAEAARGANRYKQLLTELVRYSSLQRLLPEPGRLEACVRYYEGVKSLHLTQRFPLFWLQYAIACFVEGDLKRARIYFETAYSLAAKSRFDTYQIDNHYARFLLLEATEAGLPVDKAIQNFRQARAIVNRQLQRERLHYPYKTASVYQDFIDRFGKELDERMCSEVKAAADYVLERLERLPEDMKTHPDVRRCLDSTNYVTHRCRELLLQM